MPAAKHDGAIRGLRKAAVVLISVGPDGAAEVFRHLEEDEIEALSLEMALLGNLDPKITDAVYQELVAMVQASWSSATGGVDYTREVLERSIGPQRAAELVGRLTTAVEERPFQFLQAASVERIINFLSSESPQTVALVVAHLHPTLAGRVLSQLPDTLQAQTALRVAQMGNIHPQVVRDVEKHARHAFASVPQPDHPTVVGAKLLAHILSRGDLTTEHTVLDGLKGTDERLADEVRQLLITFEDIANLDDRAIQLIIREANQKDLTLALRAASEALKQNILSNMSTRAAQTLIDELQLQPPQHRRVVEEAQDRIVAILRRLEDAGTIILPRAGEDPVL